MQTAVFILHPDLEFFIPRLSRGKELTLTFEDHQSVKHLIESLGIPHVEVGSIFANERYVDFGYQPKSGDRLHVAPPLPTRPIDPCFALDGHLGRLAAYLRLLGFDTYYENSIEDSHLIEIATTDSRILISRDRRLLMQKIIAYGYCPRSLAPLEQLSEVIIRFDLKKLFQPYKRCLHCNGKLREVNKEDILDLLLPLTKKYYQNFVMCPDCHKVYWQGSHFEYMNGLIEQLTG
jgi:uncharacterized protein